MDLENSTLNPARENLSIGMASSARFREGGAPDPRETSAKARESQDGGAPIPSPAEITWEGVCAVARESKRCVHAQGCRKLTGKVLDQMLREIVTRGVNNGDTMK